MRGASEEGLRPPRHPDGPSLAATTSDAGQEGIAFFDSDEFMHAP